MRIRTAKPRTASRQSDPLIRLSKTQFARLLKDAVEVKQLPSRGTAVFLTPSPDGGAFGYVYCPGEGPNTVCKVRETLGPGGERTAQCECPDRATPPNGPALIENRCALVYVASPLRAIRCTNNGNCNGTCRLEVTRRHTVGRRPVYVVTCRCRSR